MASLLESVFNHIVLPPKLPGRQDADLHATEHNILIRLLDVCEKLGTLSDKETQEGWQSVRRQLVVCLDLHRNYFEGRSLREALSNLHANCPLVLHIPQQNCAIFIRLVTQDDGSEDVIFEAFEASPSSTDVLAAEGTLRWDFPGRATRIPLAKFSDPSFIESLATFIEQAGTETLDRFAAHSRKAKVSVPEVRDTADPALISQMLLSLLEAIGSSAQVPKLRKRVRDDVNLVNAVLPWRRSPFWLVLRVAVQRHLCLYLGNGAGRACYKFLICCLLSRLLTDSAAGLAPELTILLRSKLCRRLAKLEMEKSEVSMECQNIYQQLFDATSSLFRNSIQAATSQVEAAWRCYRQEITPTIPRLPLRAFEGSLRLSLNNSAQYLDDVLRLAASRKRRANSDAGEKLNAKMTMDQIQGFTDTSFELTKLEQDIERYEMPATTAEACFSLAQRIIALACKTKGAFDSGPEQASTSILSLFDLWVKLDMCVVAHCPLLLEYHTGFDPELLNIIQLDTLVNMKRLKMIQEYLCGRYNRCKFKTRTMLSGPHQDCFAARFVAESPQLLKLQGKIEAASQKDRDETESRWRKASHEYDVLSEKIDSSTCSCPKNPNGSYVRGRRSRCDRCQSRRKRRKLRVAVHEDFLPSVSYLSATVVFELDTPGHLAAYRDATWTIIRTLAHPSRPQVPSSSPHMLLNNYTTLKPFTKTQSRTLSIASAKKSFLQSHYKMVKMKAEKSAVLLPHGLDFQLYDAESQLWVGDLKKPLTFSHLCGVYIPFALRGSVFPPDDHPHHDPDGPSSYEAMANQPKCPTDMSVHEFLAYQRLLSGRSRRWLTILAELGSPNLNFNSKDTMHLISQLAIQAGPVRQHKGVLRDAHVVFEDTSFCACLMEQIRRRLRMIYSNWRETYCMEMLITLSLRLFRLAAPADRDAAHELIKMAREATLGWITRLREEFWNCTDAREAEAAASYGFWASLLCRRTFATFEDSNHSMSAEELEAFIQASLALHQNLVVDLARLSPTLKNILARDMKMASRIYHMVKSAVESQPAALNRAVSGTVPDAADLNSAASSVFSPWRFLPSHNGHWATSVMKSPNPLISAQRLHYNLVDGRLLVDGSHIGKLPLAIRDSEDVKELFGDQHLLTFPSSRFGMTHVLTKHHMGQRIHFGLRGRQVIIHVVTLDGRVFEHVPRHIFCSPSSAWDLPAGLIDDCVHWLDLGSGCLEIRKKPSVWRTGRRDWILDVRRRQAQRSKVLLVDTQSDLGLSITRILGNFEDARKLTIFQPLHRNGTLSVELRHLDLSFFVNHNGLLQCRELNAEIDPNQDAGTLYGFRSGLVLRGVPCKDERSIIVPLGTVSWRREGIHVSVRTSSPDHYGRFGIDQVLGQLTCPPEPRLLYFKALLHALTSFPLPDDLTRQTGTQEALRTLKSGRCQPCQPIPDNFIASLLTIKGLVPSRKYYPPDKRCLQSVTWDNSLTTTIQHEGYESVITSLLTKSEQLRAFSENKSEGAHLQAEPSSWLTRRAEARRVCYESGTSRQSHPDQGRGDAIYRARDRDVKSPGAVNVYQIIRSFHHRPRQIHMTTSLRTILQNWKWIGGFYQTWEDSSVPPSLTNLVSGNLPEQWGNLVDDFRGMDRGDPYRALFKLALLSFAPDAKMDVLGFLAACYWLDELRDVEPPRYPSFVDFKAGEGPNLSSLEGIISNSYSESDFASTSTSGYRGWLFDTTRAELMLNQCKKEASHLAVFILEQWPRPELSTTGFQAQVLDVERAMEFVCPEWHRLYRNLKLSEYLDIVQRILDKYRSNRDTSVPMDCDSQVEAFFLPRSGGPVVPLFVQDLRLPKPPTFSTVGLLRGLRRAQRLRSSNKVPRRTGARGNKKSAAEIGELGAIISSFVSSSDSIRQEYGNSLRDSLEALKRAAGHADAEENIPDLAAIKTHLLNARSAMNERFHAAVTYFSEGDPRSQWLRLADLWLWTNPVAVLEILRSTNRCLSNQRIRELLVSYGLSVTQFQRFQRIMFAKLRGNYSKTAAEWRNAGHAGWDPLEFPDWLLLEIDGNLLIRPEQIEVAHAILSPASGSNSVLQMNMGSGKTSCIVPMAMLVLANGVQLARLVVPKALLSQTAQIMQARLGGIVGRDITHVPFSRRTPIGPTAPTMIPLYSQLHEQARLRRGIMLTTPEHILSYKLGGLQRLADTLLDEARDMISYQARLTETCRDVLDESDFTLAVRTQLIYPSGPQLPLDGQPYRWTTIQSILSLAEDHLPGVQQYCSRGLELSKRPGGFPVAHFLRREAEDELKRRLIMDISSGRTAVLASANLRERLPSDLIQEILSSDSIDSNLVAQLAGHFPNAKVASDNILLTHGLLSKRILVLCLKKRWNVQYGFHPRRHPVAVPFEAKGVPSEQSEFGHPDVALLLTCLAFYYAGLTPAQFREGLRHVLSSEDPAAEYDRWTQGSIGLPDHLRHWNSINVDHQEQFDELWSRLRFNRGVLHHYMNTFVFPAQARQFEVKIQASGWDLPLLPLSLEPSSVGVTAPRAMSTGFSGTNDNKMLLPLTIKQDDLESLSQTNAEVLTYLLQPRNREYQCAPWRSNREEFLLEELSRKGIRVLIDAGAYVLEQDNRSLAKVWLWKDPRAKAAVYFGVDNRAWVLYRNNKEAPLIATPFAEDLNECLVYLDEAHTRGVDLKMPPTARGAITLALGQTKDHTMQAAMRLRELGTTQSVVFFAPPEVHQSIVDVCKLETDQTINSSHVVAWLLEQTCRVNEQLRGLYLAQGHDFCYRANAQLLHGDKLTDKPQRAAFLDSIRRPERQTLGELYGLDRGNSSQPIAEHLLSSKLEEFVQELNRQQAVSGRGGELRAHDLAFQEVEQEREVEVQAEHVQQTQVRRTYEALRFSTLRKSIRRFAETGNLTGGQGYQHAFAAIANTSTGKKYSVRATGSQLFVSTEYMRTIDLQGRSESDDFLRPVEWILWNPTKQVALIVVPEETELLIPVMRKKYYRGKKCAVHLVTYRAPLTRDMTHFNDLSFYAIPPLPAGHQVPDWLSVELGIFAGRMYADFAECTALRQYMERADAGAFSPNPAGFLLEWLAVRRKGQDATQTPVGYVCQGRPLHEDHHFFAAPQADCRTGMNPHIESPGVTLDSDESEVSEDEWAAEDLRAAEDSRPAEDPRAQDDQKQTLSSRPAPQVKIKVSSPWWIRRSPRFN